MYGMFNQSGVIYVKCYWWGGCYHCFLDLLLLIRSFSSIEHLSQRFTSRISSVVPLHGTSVGTRNRRGQMINSFPLLRIRRSYCGTRSFG